MTDIDQVNAMAALRAATWPAHQRLEKRLDVKSRFTDLVNYQAHLERMWGFCASLEKDLAAERFDGALQDYESRRKLPLLTRDLIFLGTDRESVPLLAKCPTTPRASDAASAFGCAYVLEGATLGGKTLLPLVVGRLGVTAQNGAAYLASYGAATSAMWHEFSSALNRQCDAPERRRTAIEAAVATFAALADWLTVEPA